MSATKMLAAFAALCATTTIASAGDYTFSVDKSELSNRAGLERTAKRIERTAKEVCGVDDVRGLAREAAAKACEAQVAEHILAEIDHPELAAVYNDGDVYAAR